VAAHSSILRGQCDGERYDGAFVGNTPSVLRLSAGMHAIKIQSLGKQAWERQLQVLKDSKVSLSATLSPQT
jgi:hypothetical protein